MVGPLDLCSFPRRPPCNREGVLGLPQMETSSGSSEMLFHEHMSNNHTHCPWASSLSLVDQPHWENFPEHSPPTCLPAPAAGHPTASWWGI